YGYSLYCGQASICHVRLYPSLLHLLMQGKVLEMSSSNLSSAPKSSKTSWSLSTRQLAMIMVIGGACFLSAVWAYGSQAFGLVPLDLWSICTTNEVKTPAPSTSVWEQSLTISAD